MAGSGQRDSGAAEVKVLYEQYGFAIHQRCLRLLHNRAAADDALHEVFVRVIRYGHTFKGGSRLVWLGRIADRCCLDQIKRGKRFVAELAPEAQELAPAVGAPPRVEQWRLLAQVLARVDAKAQQVALLYYLDGMTLEEVAGALGCSTMTVKRRLFAFRKRVQVLREEGEP